jgi:hypothetical protein
MVLGSGIRKKPIPDPGSRGQKAPDPGSRIRNTAGYTGKNKDDPLLYFPVTAVAGIFM